MNIILNQISMVPIYEQIITEIKAEITRGGLKPGQILPSVRSLAADLAISALTVKKAYDRLEAEGILVTVHGKGSFVSESVAGFVAEHRRSEVEQELSAALDKAKGLGLEKNEIKELVDILLGD